MANFDLADLIVGGNEDLSIEYKRWMDTSAAESRAKLARHIAALANYGGGYLIFGVDEKTRKPQGPTTFAMPTFAQDALSSIVSRYLDPALQVLIEYAEYDGAIYPIVVVPGHTTRPVIAKADGPHDAKGNPIGIKSGTIYVRVPGPASEPIKSPDDWNALLERCLSHRSDLLGKILRQSMSSTVRSDKRNIDALKFAVEDTARDFVAQVTALAAKAPEHAGQIKPAGSAFSTMGYSLLDSDGNSIEIENLREVNQRVSVGMHQYAYYGWMAFLPLNVLERAPQIRTGDILGEEATYLEGMRLENIGVLIGTLDYWRLYDRSIGVHINSLRDGEPQPGGPTERSVSAIRILLSVHSLLAHARLTGQELSGVQQVIVRMDWRGMAGRRLMWNNYSVGSPGTVSDDRFVKTLVLEWSELRDRYFEALKRVALPLFTLFPANGWINIDEVLSPEAVAQRFEQFHPGTLKLFTD